jgi:hypothetical protein
MKWLLLLTILSGYFGSSTATAASKVRKPVRRLANHRIKRFTSSTVERFLFAQLTRMSAWWRIADPDEGASSELKNMGASHCTICCPDLLWREHEGMGLDGALSLKLGKGGKIGRG